MTLEQAHSNFYGENDQETTLSLYFQSYLAGPPGNTPDQHVDFTVVAAAAVDGGTYVWISAETVFSNFTNTVTDSKVELVSPPETLGKGDSAVFVLNAVLTQPTGEFEFTIFHPLGITVKI